MHTTPDDELLPDADEVVARLDRLWDDPPPAANAFPLGQQLGRYEIDCVIGRGAFGIVYKARDTQLDRDVALKIPRPEVLIDEDKLRRFEGEAKAAAALDHPSIVTVHEAQLDATPPYIASAYCAGPNLAQWLARQTAPIDWREAAAFVAELADAVHYAHEQGVAHRDLKPSNVLLLAQPGANSDSTALRDYQPRLTDFGLAKLAESSLADTRSSLLVGTPLYMAPEQLEHRSTHEASSADIYALGVMLFELVAGQPPIDGATYIEVVDRLRSMPPARLRELRPDAPRELEAICAKCLEKDPQARYRSAGELASDLRAAVQGQAVAVRRAGAWDRFRYWSGRPQRIRDAGWFALCVNVLMAAWLLVQASALPQFGILTAQEYQQTLVEVAVTVVVFHVAMAALGYYTLGSRPWAIRAGLAFSTVGAGWLLLALVGAFTPFSLVYRGAEYHAFAGSVLVFASMVGQWLLYVFAYRALKIGRTNGPG